MSEHLASIDSLFELMCGHVLDGCSDSDPAIKWRKAQETDKRTGYLWCDTCKQTTVLLNVVTL